MRLRVCSWACVCFLPVISSNHKGIENPMNSPRAKCDYTFPESMKSSNTCAACHKNVYLHLGKVVKLYVKCWQKVTHGNYPQKCCASNSSCNKITVNIGDNPCESCHILESKKKRQRRERQVIMPHESWSDKLRVALLPPWGIVQGAHKVDLNAHNHLFIVFDYYWFGLGFRTHKCWPFVGRFYCGLHSFKIRKNGHIGFVNACQTVLTV